MNGPKWTITLAVAILAGTGVPTAAAASAAGVDDVAILVLDGFTKAADSPPATVGGEANCFRTARGGNEVGSGGGGDELPPGVSHGQAVFEVVQAELNQPHRGLDHVGLTPTIDHPLVQQTYLDNWRHGDRQILLVGVDTDNFDTGLIATELSRIMDLIHRKLGITRFVVNMSFLVLPCDVAAWLDARPTAGGSALDPARLLATYRAIIEGVPSLSRLAAELDRLERSSPTVEAILSDPAMAEVTPLVPVNLFYGLLAGHSIADLIHNPNVPALARDAYRQITTDPLKRLLDHPPSDYRVVAVGAAGNGIFRRTAKGDRSEQVQFDFPFAPALWNSVVSVSATGPTPPLRASYSNSGEVMMVAANPYHVGGTSFAAPRLSALEGLYLFGGGLVSCDGSVPPLGYSSVADPAAPGVDMPRWDNLELSASVSAADPALVYCHEFKSRTTLPSP